MGQNVQLQGRSPFQKIRFRKRRVIENSLCTDFGIEILRSIEKNFGPRNEKNGSAELERDSAWSVGAPISYAARRTMLAHVRVRVTFPKLTSVNSRSVRKMACAIPSIRDSRRVGFFQRRILSS